MSKPKIFIGSSAEGLNVANAIQENLDHYAEVTIWSQGFFQLSTPTIISLINALDKFDYAIFVFSPDDFTNLRGKSVSTVRDNVIYETGLFTGKFGIDRVFFIKPRDYEELHLPTDLLGMTAGGYDNNRTDRNFVAATGPFCNQVKQKIESLKLIQKSSVLKDYAYDPENDMQIIFSYMKEKKWTSMSFEKLKENVHPKFSEEYLMTLVETYPKAIRRCRLKEGVYGIKIL